MPSSTPRSEFTLGWKALVAVLVAYLAFVGVWEIGLPGLLPETGR